MLNRSLTAGTKKTELKWSGIIDLDSHPELKEAVNQFTSDKGKTILYMIINVLIVIFALSVLIIGGFWLVYSRFYLGQVSAAMEIPIGIVYIIVPLSGLLISYYAIADFFSLRNKNKKLTV